MPLKHVLHYWLYLLANRVDKTIAHLGIMPYVDRFSQNFLLARWSVSYLLMYTWHTLLHYPHGVNTGCDLAGVAPVLLAHHLPWCQSNTKFYYSIKQLVCVCLNREKTNLFMLEHEYRQHSIKEKCFQWSTLRCVCMCNLNANLFGEYR